jgi:hypothetical protein
MEEEAAVQCPRALLSSLRCKQKIGSKPFREAAMKILLFALGIAVGTGLIVTCAGAQDYPWCAYSSADGASVNCGFVSFERCLTTLRGIGGICMRNKRAGPRRIRQAIHRRKLRTQYTRYALRTQSARQTDVPSTSKVAPAKHPVFTRPPTSAVATSSITDNIKKAKEMITTKLGNPASIKFPDIASGKVIGSVCGEAEVKGAGETREIPFVVQKTESYIINGSDDLKASRAIDKMCD